jgi:hypothetical protein
MTEFEQIPFGAVSADRASRAGSNRAQSFHRSLLARVGLPIAATAAQAAKAPVIRR